MRYNDAGALYTEYERGGMFYAIRNQVVIGADDLSKLRPHQLVMLSDLALEVSTDQLGTQVRYGILKHRYDHYGTLVGSVGDKSSLVKDFYRLSQETVLKKYVNVVHHKNVMFYTTDFTDMGILRILEEDRSHILMNCSTHCIFHIDKGVFKLVELPKGKTVTVGGLPHCTDKLKEIMNE